MLSVKWPPAARSGGGAGLSINPISPPLSLPRAHTPAAATLSHTQGCSGGVPPPCVGQGFEARRTQHPRSRDPIDEIKGPPAAQPSSPEASTSGGWTTRRKPGACGQCAIPCFVLDFNGVRPPLLLDRWVPCKGLDNLSSLSRPPPPDRRLLSQ